MQTPYIQVKQNTKQRFLELQKIIAEKNPDLKTNQDYILRKLMDKYEGDLQWTMNTLTTNYKKFTKNHK